MTSEIWTWLHLDLPSCFWGNELQNQIDGRSGSGFEYTHAQLETIIQFTSLETDEEREKTSEKSWGEDNPGTFRRGIMRDDT